MLSYARALLAGGLAAAGFSSAALAEDFPPCETFTLMGGPPEITAIDSGVTGDSIGDERIGERPLMNADGAVIGTVRWISHIVDAEAGEGEDIAINQNIYILPDGTLHATSHVTFNTPLNPETQPLNRSAIAILGGTGVYARSEGEVKATFAAGKPARFVFELYCD